MVVRGAPAIGVAAAYAYCLAALAGEGLDEAKETLAASRPTAVNLFWALERMERKAKECGGAAEPLIAEAKAIHAEDVAMCRAMGAHGAAVVPEHARILTHCNAGALATGGYGTALGVIRAAHEAGKVNMVYCDETRPLLQGARLTAYELVSDHIPATLIADNMAASLMAKGKIDLAVVGCDRMAANGDFANRSEPTPWRSTPITTAFLFMWPSPAPPSTCLWPTGAASPSRSGTGTRCAPCTAPAPPRSRWRSATPLST